MASPFPGMDPYLEGQNIWPGFHHRLADELADRLNTHIGPKYYAEVEVRTVFQEVSIAAPRAFYPDVGVYEQLPREPEPVPAGAAVAVLPAPVQRAVVTGQTKLRAVRVHLTETDDLVTSIEILSPYNKATGGGTSRVSPQTLATPLILCPPGRDRFAARRQTAGPGSERSPARC